MSASWVHIKKADGSVESFTINELPVKRKVNIVSLIRTDRSVMGVTKQGKLYSITGVPNGNGTYIGWSWWWIPELANILNKFGLITDDDLNATIAIHESQKEQQRVDRLVSDIKSDTKSLGLVLTKAQLRKLESMS
jgi:hypothetical protein